MYQDIADAIESFKEKGYVHTYQLTDNVISCEELKKTFLPAELTIKESYRQDSGTDPGSESTAYAIESKDGDKGVLVVAFGMYADPGKAKLIDQLLSK